MIHETTCDACGTKGTYDSETGEGTVRPGRADGTEMHRTYCDACAQLSDVARARAALKAAGYDTTRRADGRIVVPVEDDGKSSGDSALEEIRSIVAPLGFAAEWTGDGNDGTSDVAVEAAP